MITIQIPEARHGEAVSRFIENHKLTIRTPLNPEESMVLIEDDSILGYAAYRRQGDEAAVAMLYIDPAMRRLGFGDGLLRALLNLMERNWIRRFLIPADESAKSFLLSEDLIPSSDTPDWAEAPMPNAFWFEGTLPEFFQKPCKGGHR